MTGTLMVDLIQRQARETAPAGEQAYTRAICVDAINETELELAGTLDNKYLAEYIKTAASKLATGGIYALSGITAGIVGGEAGIVRVRISGGKWCTPIFDPKTLDNSFTAPTTNEPGYRVIDNSIKVYQSSALATCTIDFEYKETPAAITISGETVSGTPVLNPSYHYLLALGAKFRTLATLPENISLIDMASKVYYKEIAELNKKAGA